VSVGHDDEVNHDEAALEAIEDERARLFPAIEAAAAEAAANRANAPEAIEVLQARASDAVLAMLDRGAADDNRRRERESARRAYERDARILNESKPAAPKTAIPNPAAPTHAHDMAGELVVGVQDPKLCEVCRRSALIWADEAGLLSPIRGERPRAVLEAGQRRQWTAPNKSVNGPFIVAPGSAPDWWDCVYENVTCGRWGASSEQLIDGSVLLADAAPAAGVTAAAEAAKHYCRSFAIDVRAFGVPPVHMSPVHRRKKLVFLPPEFFVDPSAELRAQLTEAGARMLKTCDTCGGTGGDGPVCDTCRGSGSVAS
jgi:hypothetical protein